MIYIITGDIETGKSKALLNWIEGRIDVFGILCPRNNHHVHYFLDVSKQKSFTMVANPEDDSIISVGRYHFLKSAFKNANAIIEDAAKTKESGYIIIDEIGKLELRSEGLHESVVLAIDKTINSNNLHTILVVRKTLLEAVKQKYNIVNAKFLSVKELSAVCI